MTYQLERDESNAFSRLTLSGVVEVDGLLEAVRAMWASPQHDQRTLMIIAPGAEIALTGDDIRIAAGALSRERADVRPGRAAVVAPSDLVYGLARMIQVLMREVPTDLQVFRAEQDAMDWLREEESS